MTHTVDPMPFAAMSNFPYPDTESYPDDTAHQDYLANWNTREVAGVAAPLQSGGLAGLLDTATDFVRGLWDGLVALVVPGQGDLIARANSAVQDGTSSIQSFPSAETSVLNPPTRSLHTDYVGLEIGMNVSTEQGPCLSCHAVHGATSDGEIVRGSAWARDERLCGGDGTGCHSAPRNNGTSVMDDFTVSSDPVTHHDVLLEDQDATGARIECSSCHNPHMNSRNEEFSDPDEIGTSLTKEFAEYADAQGDVYVIVGGEHDAVAPVISNLLTDVVTNGWLTPTIRWDTDESATSWVDYGTDTSYSLGTTGTASLSTAHAVIMPALTPGTTYHFRVRTADALGNETSSADFTYMPVAPPATPTAYRAQDATVNGSFGPYTVDVTVTWSSVGTSAPDGDPVEYVVEARNGVDPYPWRSTVTTGTSWTLTGLTGTQPATTYTWRVRARDSVHTQATSGWAESNFTVLDELPSSSCPFLFTYDGTEHAFEADLYGAGKLALKTSRGYTRPEPNDYYVLNNEPALLDGKLDLRLVEERYEVDYLDELKLYSIDASAGVRVIAEKPQAPGDGTFAGLDPVVHTIAEVAVCPPECRARADWRGRALQDRGR